MLLCWPSVVRPRAAGVTWTSRILKAPWAARYGHTTVFNAAGDIYIIGGYGAGTTYFDDVWLSTDGGADRTRGALPGGTWRLLGGYYRVVRGYSRGTQLVLRDLRGTPGVLGWYYAMLHALETLSMCTQGAR